ncbi:helix-turn-helix domain-containing protein [Streptomyces scopuliridis]|uniref:Helix-turn-helix domain-containing protein n=1 Tax=Streptomyces scopuliridis TaxID=452529 RepID=A0ACD4ZR54_9ACTN|nr:helix-turn-helix domain-containing protein [Streptomyces scopuliridis]WSB36325.1 helix-turn-helix domain-containing protein [Streptomyces scopuliridis]WSC00621.1 helix-turn-helix domain-containing protein [Streptomyces scopuliridis]WSC05768.1 helix-turn-helix domain-containing protein [Streptomyces scopuliridis]
MSDTEPRRITDLDTLKAFGHPLRMKLYRALYIARTATASQLADQVDEAVSLVSYHLRKLADHGLIEEAEPQGNDGRERWWRPASQGLSFHDADFHDAPEKAATHAAVGRMSFEQRSDLYRGYLDTQAAWGAEWRSASFSSEYLAPLTAAELAALSDELHRLVKKYEAAGRAAEGAGDTEGRENVALHLYGFPFRV